MGTPGNHTGAALAHDGAEEVGHLLVDLEGATGCVSGNVIEYRMPCTAAEDTTCQIVPHLSVWNEFLRWLNLELRELSETGRQLGLVHSPINCFSSREEENKMHQAATLLYWLFKTHHCVVSVHIPEHWDCVKSSQVYGHILWEALEGNSSIKCLALGHLSPIVSASIDKVLLSLKSIEQLEFGVRSSDFTILPAISTLLQTTRTLTKLQVLFKPRLEGSQAEFFTALRANSTLRDLTLVSNLYQQDPTLFVEFLASTTTLQHLRVVASPRHCHQDFGDYSFKWVFRGMLMNSTVCSLEARYFSLDAESTELGARMLAENNVLRNFKFLPFYSRQCTVSTTDVIRPGKCADIVIWLEAISQNNTLEYVTFSFGMCRAEQWRSFFRVLSKKRSLKMVTIDVQKNEYGHLAGVVGDLERSGSKEKVSIKAPCSIDTLALSDCKYCSKLEAHVKINSDPNIFPVFQQLPTFSHLNTLSLRMERWDSVICSLVAEYIATTSTLQMLHMQFCRPFDPPESVKWWRALSQSLLLNRSITELGIGFSVISCEDVIFLADTVIQGVAIRKIRLLYLSASPYRCFIRGLRAGIFKNRTLCSATGYNDYEGADDWFAVYDTARRNSGFVARAAQFLNHARCDRLCAAGLDRVSRHPALVAELAEVLSIDKVEAAHMVRQKFRCIEGLHDFMRLAGVVKEQVTCLPRQDGRTQLDGLTQDCWAHVRRYLELDDVAYETAPHRRICRRVSVAT